MATPARVQRRNSSEVGFRGPDWVAAVPNLRLLHTFTKTLVDFGIVDVAGVDIADLHELVHDLARALGAPDGWLHEGMIE
jgi:hypothetical protein